MIEITLAGKPLGKQVIQSSEGVFYKASKTNDYMARLTYAAQQVMEGRAPLTGPIKLSVQAFMPVAVSWPKKRQTAALIGEIRPTGKPDWDNIGKMLDALNLIVWTDDAQIVDGRVVKFYSDRPRLVVQVSQLEAEMFG